MSVDFKICQPSSRCAVVQCGNVSAAIQMQPHGILVGKTEGFKGTGHVHNSQ